MNVKECLFRMHHGVFISDDDEDMLSEFREITGMKFKMRPDEKYTADMQEYKTFERMIDRDLYLGIQQPNASGLRGPQGTKGTARGVSYDSIWEFAYYVWKVDVNGELCERNKTEWVPYTDERCKIRRFYPDFKIATGFAEVKGIMRPSDIQKMEQHPEIEFIQGDQMKEIMKELNQKVPNWRSEYMSS